MTLRRQVAWNCHRLLLGLALLLAVLAVPAGAQPASPYDGAFVADPDGTLWLVLGRLRYPLAPDRLPPALLPRLRPGGPVTTLAEVLEELTPQRAAAGELAPLHGALVTADDGRTWLVLGSVRRPIEPIGVGVDDLAGLVAGEPVANLLGLPEQAAAANAALAVPPGPPAMPPAAADAVAAPVALAGPVSIAPPVLPTATPIPATRIDGAVTIDFRYDYKDRKGATIYVYRVKVRAWRVETATGQKRPLVGADVRFESELGTYASIERFAPTDLNGETWARFETYTQRWGGKFNICADGTCVWIERYSF